MTFLMIITILVVGIAVLIAGFITKTKWLKLLSIIPLAISVWQLVSLFLISF